MKSLLVLAVATTLALTKPFAIPDQTTRNTQHATDNSSDHAIRVRDSGTYPKDGVMLPVFEPLEARYAAADREFTVEYWFKLPSGADSNNKELLDHHEPSMEGFWTAFQNSQLWAGIDAEAGNDDGSNDAIHIRTGSGFNDGEWHHYALVRDLGSSPDRLCLYLDGVGSCYENGSVPERAPVSADIRPPENRDGDDGNNFPPFYVIGSRTSGAGQIEATIDELRISDVARYDSDFTPLEVPFVLDADTVMLFHFDEGSGDTTYGYDSNNTALEGILVKNPGWYGLTDVEYFDTGNPTDATWLDEMWTDGRFGSTASSLTLTSPNGGRLWQTGTQHQITWTWSGSITHVSLSYSTDGFTAISHTIAASTPNTGVYTWTTPITPSTTARVRVADTANPTIYDDSNADFVLTDTIYPMYLPVILKSWQ